MMKTTTKRNLRKLFEDYFEFEHDESQVYLVGHFAKMFKVSNQTARYHLIKHVDKGVLCMITYKGNVYYASRKHYESLKDFEKIKVLKVV